MICCDFFPHHGPRLLTKSKGVSIESRIMGGHDESSSSEDLPLSALAKRNFAESSDEAEFDNENDDEEHDSSDFLDDNSGAGNDDADDEDPASDSSDDVPLKSLKSQKATVAKRDATKKKVAASTKKKKSTTKKKSFKSKQSSSSSVGNWLSASGELYPQCDKGKLIQSILARW